MKNNLENTINAKLRSIGMAETTANATRLRNHAVTASNIVTKITEMTAEAVFAVCRPPADKKKEGAKNV